MAVEGPDIKEDIQDKFRQYYLDYKKQNNTFPNFPEENDFFQSDFKFGDKPKTDDAKADPKEDKKGGTLSFLFNSKYNYHLAAKKDAGKKGKDGAGDDDPLLKFDTSDFLPKIKDVYVSTTI